MAIQYFKVMHFVNSEAMLQPQCYVALSHLNGEANPRPST